MCLACRENSGAQQPTGDADVFGDKYDWWIATEMGRVQGMGSPLKAKAPEFAVTRGQVRVALQRLQWPKDRFLASAPIALSAFAGPGLDGVERLRIDGINPSGTLAAIHVLAIGPDAREVETVYRVQPSENFTGPSLGISQDELLRVLPWDEYCVVLGVQGPRPGRAELAEPAPLPFCLDEGTYSAVALEDSRGLLSNFVPVPLIDLSNVGSGRGDAEGAE